MRIPVLLILCCASAASAADLPDFDRDVRPILAQHCFSCHGPEKQKGGLRLDQKTVVLNGGDSEEPTVVPGNVAKSALIKRVLTKDADEVMPPKGERMPAAQVAVLQKWVETGAHWIDPTKATQEAPSEAEVAITDKDRAFWSFQPPRRHELPPVRDRSWPRSRSDHFILAKLESRNLAPAAEADRRTLIRRVTFDLTGLPPTPEQVEQFLSDNSPEAYDRLVDRLLASSRFGERMASLWLPLARYAEDQAHQVGSDTKFFYPHAYKYRDWVINSFNDDLPYDQFLKLQLAADQLPTGNSQLATGNLPALGFLGLGPKYYNRNRLEVMADEWEDRVDTVTRTMLGLTVACARCHDHKFDPISARDYHALAGVFASTRMVNKTAAGVVIKNDVMADKMDPATLHVVEDGELQNLNLFIRGNVNRKGAVVPRRFLSILSGESDSVFKQGSGRRELAEAIASRRNPLTARVMVNRVWGQLFGRPIVATPSNFGHSGQPPSHPELLDGLAVSFMDNGWSVKSLVRELVTSSTYRQSAAVPPSNADPDNELFGRMNRRRLTVEQWRDSVMFLSQRLEFGGGKSLELTDPKNLRRTVYARVSRLQLNDMLMQFDYPDANVHAERRSVTNTPLQKLFVLNSEFMNDQSRWFAGRLAKEVPDGGDARVRRAYQLLFARDPDDAELRPARAFLAGPDGRLTRWDMYAHVLLSSNEALYVD